MRRGADSTLGELRVAASASVARGGDGGLANEGGAASEAVDAALAKEQGVSERSVVGKKKVRTNSGSTEQSPPAGTRLSQLAVPALQ